MKKSYYESYKANGYDISVMLDEGQQLIECCYWPLIRCVSFYSRDVVAYDQSNTVAVFKIKKLKNDIQNQES